MFPAVLSIIAVVFLGVIIAFACRWAWMRGRESRIVKARDLFHRQREAAEARFVKLAGSRGLPRGLEWTDVDFADDARFARDRTTGQLRAFVEITITFEAIEGGGMEDNENVGYLRTGTAVFRLDSSKWDTDGRAILNLNPEEAIDHFQSELEPVD